MASKDLGVKKTGPEKAGVSQRDYEQGAWQPIDAPGFQSQKSPDLSPIRHRSNQVERNSWSCMTGTLGHSQEAWLYFSILPNLLCSVCIHKAFGQEEWMHIYWGWSSPYGTRRETGTVYLRPQGKTSRQSSLFYWRLSYTSGARQRDIQQIFIEYLLCVRC